MFKKLFYKWSSPVYRSFLHNSTTKQQRKIVNILKLFLKKLPKYVSPIKIHPKEIFFKDNLKSVSSDYKTFFYNSIM